MPRPGNPNFNAQVARDQQSPVYYLQVDGLTTQHFSTAPVAGAVVPKLVCMSTPKATGAQLELIDGTQTVGVVRLKLLDVDGAITQLVAYEVAGAPVPTLKNRKVTLWGGYRTLDEADYIPIYTGRITELELDADLSGYDLQLADGTLALDGEIMSEATDIKKVTISGNIVNVCMSILRDVFDVADPDFPLTSVSINGPNTAVPSGLGIADTELDIDGIKAERDRWHLIDEVRAEWVEPENARDWLEAEVFRIFQAWMPILGDGRLSLRFKTPPLTAAAIPELGTADIIDVTSWRRDWDGHLNAFTILGDHDTDNDEYPTTLYQIENSTDQANTDERIEYLGSSRLLRSDLDGAEIARELAARLNLQYPQMPAVVQLTVNLHQRNLEVGDVVAVTHPRLPDLRDGTRGVLSRNMRILRRDPDFRKGLFNLTLMDVGFKRYGVIAPEASVGDYLTVSETDRSTFFYICNESGKMSNGDEGYRFT